MTNENSSPPARRWDVSASDEEQIKRFDTKLKWLTAVAAAIAPLFAALDKFKVIEPAGWGRITYAAAALFLALTVALLARAWLLPPTTAGLTSKGKSAKWGAITGLATILCAGTTPIVSVLLPELETGLLGKRLVLGYAVVPGHPDSLAVSVSGRIDPTASLVLHLSTSDANCTEDKKVATWGVMPSASGEVTFSGRATVAGHENKRLCLKALRSENGEQSEEIYVIISAVTS